MKANLYFWYAFWAYFGWKCGEYTFVIIGVLWKIFCLKYGTGSEI
jgi:hypothetical protein